MPVATEEMSHPAGEEQSENTSMSTTKPSVSVILPVLNEADFIENVLDDLTRQDYEGPLEIVVADGGSVDGTLDVLSEWSKDSRVRVIANPRRRQAFGLNLAAAEATGPILVRADGHTRYAQNYVSASVAALSQVGGAVGGRMNPEGANGVGKAVAAVMNSPLTMGPGRFHHALRREEVDTVYLGSFLKEDYDAVGGFRSFPSGSSEDADFYYRWRRSGRKVFVDPAIETVYSPRVSMASLWRQYWRYGRGKTEMLWLNGRLPSSRPLAPILLVLALALSLTVGFLAVSWWPLIAVIAVWLMTLLIVGGRSGESVALVVVAAGIMHVAYGLGAVVGFVRGPFPLRHLR